MTLARSIAWLALFVGAACRPPAKSARSGEIRVDWTGADTAAFDGPATAEWCAADHRLTVTAIGGDTAVGLLLRTKDKRLGGKYPVLDPMLDTAAAPRAAIAVRWLGNIALMAFRGRAGSVTVEATDGRTVTGRFKSDVVAAMGPATLAVTGHFSRVPVRAHCPPPPPPAPGQTPDSSVSSTHGKHVLPARIRAQDRNRRPAKRPLSQRPGRSPQG